MAQGDKKRKTPTTIENSADEKPSADEPGSRKGWAICALFSHGLAPPPPKCIHLHPPLLFHLFSSILPSIQACFTLPLIDHFRNSSADLISTGSSMFSNNNCLLPFVEEKNFASMYQLSLLVLLLTPWTTICLRFSFHGHNEQLLWMLDIALLLYVHANMSS